jgi:hypothetical protein
LLAKPTQLRRIAATAGGPTDTSRYHELTNWAEVETMTRGFAVQLRRNLAAAATA